MRLTREHKNECTTVRLEAVKRSDPRQTSACGFLPAHSFVDRRKLKFLQLVKELCFVSIDGRFDCLNVALGQRLNQRTDQIAFRWLQSAAIMLLLQIKDRRRWTHHLRFGVTQPNSNASELLPIGRSKRNLFNIDVGKSSRNPWIARQLCLELDFRGATKLQRLTTHCGAISRDVGQHSKDRSHRRETGLLKYSRGPVICHRDANAKTNRFEPGVSSLVIAYDPNPNRCSIRRAFFHGGQELQSNCRLNCLAETQRVHQNRNRISVVNRVVAPAGDRLFPKLISGRFCRWFRDSNEKGLRIEELSRQDSLFELCLIHIGRRSRHRPVLDPDADKVWEIGITKGADFHLGVVKDVGQRRDHLPTRKEMSTQIQFVHVSGIDA